jgi:Phosphoinositide phospholipase C, Ca2+-dependent
MTMKYNAASYKASHNSYDRDEDSHQSLSWHENDKGKDGCRGLEYDIWRHSDDSVGRSLGYFTVAHTTSGGPPFASYLGYLLSWHLAKPDHDVVSVIVDIKSTGGSEKPFPQEIDNYLREWFSASLIYTPHMLCPNSNDFVAYVKANGWPDVDALRGKFVFILSGNEKWKAFYAQDDPQARLCFADHDWDDSKAVSIPSSGQRIIYSSNLFSDNFAKWKASVASLRAANLIARGYVINSDSLWQKCKEAKLNVFATDKIEKNAWAHVGETPFVSL